MILSGRFQHITQNNFATPLNGILFKFESQRDSFYSRSKLHEAFSGVYASYIISWPRWNLLYLESPTLHHPFCYTTFSSTFFSLWAPLPPLAGFEHQSSRPCLACFRASWPGIMSAWNMTNVALSRDSFFDGKELLAELEISNTAQRYNKTHWCCWIFFKCCYLWWVLLLALKAY